METPIAVEPDAKDLEIAQLKEEAAQYKDRLLRTAADMENLRKRAERERAEATLYAATNFARDLLSVADNMSRALAAVSPDARENADEMTKNLLAGVELTERELLKVFERYNIRKVETVGAKFDPNFHQALFEVPTKDHPPARSSRRCSPASPSASGACGRRWWAWRRRGLKAGFHYKVWHCRACPGNPLFRERAC